MSTRAKRNARLAGADEAELQRLRRLYAGDPEAQAAIEKKLNPSTPKRAARRTTPSKMINLDNVRYLTWRQLFELRTKLNLTDEQLDEPATFTVQSGYGEQIAYPVSHWTESKHPSDDTSSLVLDGQELEMLLPGEFESEVDEDEEETRRFLRKLPHGGLRLGYSEMDEDFDEAVEFLAQLNPHTLPPAPRVPGPVPLFDTPQEGAAQ